jgi:predicted kinase
MPTKEGRPILYVLIGVPGSGKSTWAHNQEWFKDCAYINTDTWVELHAMEKGKTYSEVFVEYMPKAVNIMTENVELARHVNQDIIWDQTSTTLASRKRKFNMLPDYYRIAVWFTTPDEEELKKRLSSRPGKIVPDEIVKSMIDNFEIPDFEQEGWNEVWRV